MREQGVNAAPGPVVRPEIAANANRDPRERNRLIRRHSDRAWVGFVPYRANVRVSPFGQGDSCDRAGRVGGAGRARTSSVADFEEGSGPGKVAQAAARESPIHGTFPLRVETRTEHSQPLPDEEANRRYNERRMALG